MLDYKVILQKGADALLRWELSIVNAVGLNWLESLLNGAFLVSDNTADVNRDHFLSLSSGLVQAKDSGLS